MRNPFWTQMHPTPEWCKQTCAEIPKRSEILDSQDIESVLLQDLGSYIFIFSRDLKDLGSCHDNISVQDPIGILDLGQKKNLLDPGDPGSSLSNLSWDLVDL